MPAKPPLSEKAKKGEPRSRRSYACGPCKQYKTRCNLETPCLSCISAKRENECRKNPPNPPSEAEKSRIEKRKNKSTQRKSTVGGTAIKSSHSRQNSQDNGIKTPPVLKYSFGVGVDLFNPPAPDVISPPRIRVPHLKDFAFIKQSYIAWAQEAVVLQLADYLRIKEMGRQLTYSQLHRYFVRFSNWDSDGFQYLVDAQGCFNVASNFISKIPFMADDLVSRTFNALLIRGLTVAFIIISVGKVLEGDVAAAHAYLSLSDDLMALSGPRHTLGDFIHLGVYVLLNKVPSTLLNHPLRLTRMFEDLTMKMSTSKEVLHYLTMTDPAQQEGNEEFLAFARVWVLARFAELELSILGAQGSLQMSVLEGKKSILPDPALCLRLFHTEVDVLAPDWHLFDIVSALSSRHFPRFEVVPDVHQLIQLYLILYLGLSMVVAPLTSRMYLELMENNTSITGVLKYTDAILLLLLVNFYATRWLRLSKIEKPHFPTLRFAHFVSTLMSTFNWIEELDYRLFAGDGRIYPLVMGHSKNFLFLQVYLQLTHQAMFLVVFAQFRSPLSHLLTIDIDYIFRCVYAAMSSVLLKIRHLEPFCNIPAIANILAVVEALEEFALSTPILADDAEELIESLQTYVEPLVWEAMTLMLFGSRYICDSYIEQLWHLALEVQSNGTAELYITKDIRLDTNFFRNYETSFEPFRFEPELAEEYIHDVVDPAMASLQDADGRDRKSVV